MNQDRRSSGENKWSVKYTMNFVADYRGTVVPKLIVLDHTIGPPQGIEVRDPWNLVDFRPNFDEQFIFGHF